MTYKEGVFKMKSTANAHTPKPAEVPAEAPAALDTTQTGTLIRAALSLSQAIESLSRLNLLGGPGLPDVSNGLSFYEQVSRFESALILEALRVARGRQREASALLGLKPTTFNTMLKRYGIASAAFTTGGDVEPAREAAEPAPPQHTAAAQGARRTARARQRRGGHAKGAAGVSEGRKADAF
jgi:hypothetical protein